MWMTPFYLFLGVLFLEIFRKNIDLKKIKRFYFIFYFSLFYPSFILECQLLIKLKEQIIQEKKFQDLVQNKWDDNFVNDIKIVMVMNGQQEIYHII